MSMVMTAGVAIAASSLSMLRTSTPPRSPPADWPPPSRGHRLGRRRVRSISQILNEWVPARLEAGCGAAPWWLRHRGCSWLTLQMR